MDADLATLNDARKFAGTWIFRVDDRIFLILRLDVDGANLSGTLARPKHLSEASGGPITVTDPTVTVATVRDGTVEGRELHFSTQSQDESKSVDQHTMIVWDRDHASLSFDNREGMPRWNLLRAKETRDLSIATLWLADNPRLFSPEVLALQE
jgi:hypothetical protein